MVVMDEEGVLQGENWSRLGKFLKGVAGPIWANWGKGFWQGFV